MPFGRMEMIQLCVLILIVPAQYFISCYFSSTSDSDAQLHVLIKKLEYFLKSSCAIVDEIIVYLRLFIFSFINHHYIEEKLIDHNSLENNIVFFAGSTKPRSPRPAHVKYRIGQVIRHKYYGYKGVIIGWDPTTLAPDAWLNQFYGNKKELIKNPSYSILVDNRDRDRMHQTYVNEDNIEIIENTKVIHAQVDDYFEEFDGYRYIPRPKLKIIYPND